MFSAIHMLMLYDMYDTAFGYLQIDYSIFY